MAAVVPFGDILEGAKVRYTTIDGKPYLSVRDIIMVVCGKDNNCACRTWRRDVTEEQHKELEDYVQTFQFPGAGQKVQDVIEFQGAIKLTMWLPGEVAKAFRGKAVEILMRYFDGDMTLVNDIEKNKSIGYEAACLTFISSAIVKHKRDREEMPKSSWIYGTQSKAFPGLIKIGRSRNIKARLSSGNSFCAPEPHVLIAAAPTFNPMRDEDAAHTYFSEFRVHGEFFQISESSLKTYFSQILTPLYQQELIDAISSL
jgi:hypothetical protein